MVMGSVRVTPLVMDPEWVTEWVRGSAKETQWVMGPDWAKEWGMGSAWGSASPLE